MGNVSNREKAILIGLFLSKYDKKALNCFGFSGFKEAFNVFGYSVKTPPSSIKNYRDEFDPYFPNGRKGWHNRELRDYCREIMTKVEKLSFDEFYRLINSFLLDEYVSLEDFKANNKNTKQRKSMTNRLITGKAAEEYFVLNYANIEPFCNYSLIDTTNMGCGFDYKLSLGTDNFYIEVKGINERQGNVSMTEKEYNMAEDLMERYCLFIVSNFKKIPEHQLFFNPINSGDLIFQRQEHHVLQVSYSTNIKNQ